MIKLLRLCALASAFVVATASAAVAAPPTEVYGKLPSVEMVTLSPSGGRIALIGAVGEARKIIVAEVGDPGKGDVKAIFTIGIGAAKIRDVRWAGDDHILITQSKTVDLGPEFTVGRHELDTIQVVNVSTHKAFTIFGGRRDVSNVVFGQYGEAKIGDHWYGYFGGVSYVLDSARDYILDHTYPDLYQVDLDTGALTKMGQAAENSSDWVVGPDGAVIARATYDERSGDWSIFAGQWGGRRLASGRYRFGGVSLYRGRTDASILVRRPTEQGDIDEELPLAGGAATPAADNEIIDDLMFDRTKGLWVGFTTIGDVPETHVFDPHASARVKGARNAFPEQSADIASWSEDFGRMIVFTSGGDDSGTYWLVEIATGNADPVGYQYPAVQPSAVGPIKMVEWKAADGTALHGVLSLPPGREAKNLPVVVLPHGGPEARDYPVFDWWAQAFASQGYAVLQPNFRGSSGYGTTFRDAGFGEWGRKMQTDVSDGLADLARKGVVDAKRACIVGGSYGGYAALAGVTVQQGLYRCAVSVAGVSDLEGMLRYEADGHGERGPTTRYWKTFMGPDTASIDPLRLAARADAPVLLIHGKDDTVVPYDQSVAMERALRTAGKTVNLVTLTGEDHWLSREETRKVMLTSAVAFVEKYNPPDPPPASH